MPRKQSAILDYKLRIRESLRRRIEVAAKRRNVSLNFEMASRLERSFDQESQRSMDETAEHLKTVLERFAMAHHEANMLGDLVRATEALIETVQAGKDTTEAVARARQVIQMIDREATLGVRRMRTRYDGPAGE
jgi:hypothetical protein